MTINFNEPIWITPPSVKGDGAIAGGGVSEEQVNALISANAGAGVVLGFSGTLEQNTLVFRPENVDSYVLNNNFDYEIDLVFPAVGTLPDETKVIIHNNGDKINIRNILSGLLDATYGDLRQLCSYDKDFGWRWIFNARYKTVGNDKAFITQASPIALAQNLQDPSEHTAPSTLAVSNSIVNIENAIENFVRVDDYATMVNAGVSKVNPAKGVTITMDGELAVTKASESQIQAKVNEYRPICPVDIDLAVKVGVTSNANMLTDEEKTNAKSWLGVLKEQTLTQDEYDALVTKDSNTIYYIKEEI